MSPRAYTASTQSGAIMPMKKRTASKWTDHDEAPHLRRNWFKRAEIREGERLVRRAKPGRSRQPRPSKT
jgi:hypothetical protein